MLGLQKTSKLLFCYNLSDYMHVRNLTNEELMSIHQEIFSTAVICFCCV